MLRGPQIPTLFLTKLLPGLLSQVLPCQTYVIQMKILVLTCAHAELREELTGGTAP